MPNNKIANKSRTRSNMSTLKHAIHRPLLLSSLVISISLAGCASTATTVPDQNDPWTDWNRGTQTFNDNLDKAILKPMAKGYQWITPEFVDEGITNFFSNINDIGVTFNDLLQLKLTQSGMDASRFLINTTAGVAGFIDVAKMIDLPMNKMIVNLDRTGNTSAATIPIAFDEAVRDGRIKRDQHVLMAAFGAGLTSGSILLRY